MPKCLSRACDPGLLHHVTGFHRVIRSMPSHQSQYRKKTVDAMLVIQRLHQHRAWVNRNLLEAATLVSKEQLHSPFSIGQGSIWKSLVHLYAADSFGSKHCLAMKIRLYRVTYREKFPAINWATAESNLCMNCKCFGRHWNSDGQAI